MRFFSIITAMLVVGALYFLVFEREKLMNFAAGTPEISTENTASEATEVAGADVVAG